MKEQLTALFEKWKQSAKKLKSEVYVLFLAYRHPGTPWYAKVFAGLVIAYAFSPIDLIPDFIPVLGYLDDLILVPLGVALAVKMIPAAVMEACRAQAEIESWQDKPTNWVAAAVIIAIWVTLAVLAIIWVVKLIGLGYRAESEPATHWLTADMRSWK